MKKFFLAAFVCLISATSFAREGVTTTVVSRDTIFYNQALRSVKGAENAAYYRLLAKESYKGVERDIFQLDLGNDANTVLDGHVTAYYPNGMEKWHCNYKDGKREGYLTLHLRDGSIGVVAYREGKSRFDYMTITHPDGRMEKVGLKHYSSLIQ